MNTLPMWKFSLLNSMVELLPLLQARSLRRYKLSSRNKKWTKIWLTQNNRNYQHLCWLSSVLKRTRYRFRNWSKLWWAVHCPERSQLSQRAVVVLPSSVLISSCDDVTKNKKWKSRSNSRVRKARVRRWPDMLRFRTQLKMSISPLIQHNRRQKR